MPAVARNHAFSRRSSDLSKHSAQVFREAEEHPVTVVRRDGAPLVLMAQREVEARDQLVDLAGRIMTAALDGGPIVTGLERAFPWMAALSDGDRAACAQELVDAARASFGTGQPHRALSALTAWRETAEAIAAGRGTTQVDWLVQPVPVEKP